MLINPFEVFINFSKWEPAIYQSKKWEMNSHSFQYFLRELNIILFLYYCLFISHLHQLKWMSTLDARRAFFPYFSRINFFVIQFNIRNIIQNNKSSELLWVIHSCRRQIMGKLIGITHWITESVHFAFIEPAIKICSAKIE